MSPGEEPVSAPPDWWKTFFTGLIVDFWRVAMPREATLAEADFFERSLALSPGARVLDVPCGDGRLALELARRGYRMTGVDISDGFLAAAREASARDGLDIEWRLCDMRDLPWRARFDAAFCGGSSFGYLGDEGDAAYLAAVARTLQPRARFAIDSVKAAEVILAQFRARHEMEIGDIRFVGENQHDHENGWVQNRYTVTRGEKSETRLARYRLYTYREIARMLESASFEDVKGLGSLAGEPFHLGSQRLILLATRRA